MKNQCFQKWAPVAMVALISACIRQFISQVEKVAQSLSDSFVILALIDPHMSPHRQLFDQAVKIVHHLRDQFVILALMHPYTSPHRCFNET